MSRTENFFSFFLTKNKTHKKETLELNNDDEMWNNMGILMCSAFYTSLKIRAELKTTERENLSNENGKTNEHMALENHHVFIHFHSYSVYRRDNRFFWWILFMLNKDVQRFFPDSFVCVYVCMQLLYVCMWKWKREKNWALNILWLTMCFNIFQRGNDERKFSSSAASL